MTFNGKMVFGKINVRIIVEKTRVFGRFWAHILGLFFYTRDNTLKICEITPIVLTLFLEEMKRLIGKRLKCVNSKRNYVKLNEIERD
jgi:hypothetical protein